MASKFARPKSCKTGGKYRHRNMGVARPHSRRLYGAMHALINHNNCFPLLALVYH